MIKEIFLICFCLAITTGTSAKKNKRVCNEGGICTRDGKQCGATYTCCQRGDGDYLPLKIDIDTQECCNGTGERYKLKTEICHIRKNGKAEVLKRFNNSENICELTRPINNELYREKNLKCCVAKGEKYGKLYPLRRDKMECSGDKYIELDSGKTVCKKISLSDKKKILKKLRKIQGATVFSANALSRQADKVILGNVQHLEIKKRKNRSHRVSRAIVDCDMDKNTTVLIIPISP